MSDGSSNKQTTILTADIMPSCPEDVHFLLKSDDLSCIGDRRYRNSFSHTYFSTQMMCLISKCAKGVCALAWWWMFHVFHFITWKVLSLCKDKFCVIYLTSVSFHCCKELSQVFLINKHAMSHGTFSTQSLCRSTWFTYS